jgi:hypothetical protein
MTNKLQISKCNDPKSKDQSQIPKLLKNIVFHFNRFLICSLATFIASLSLSPLGPPA